MKEITESEMLQKKKVSGYNKVMPKESGTT